MIIIIITIIIIIKLIGVVEKPDELMIYSMISRMIDHITLDTLKFECLIHRDQLC